VTARTIRVASDLDAADAARAARELAEACGLSAVEAQQVATATSEVAMNAWKYAGAGEVEVAAAEAEGRRGVRVRVLDRGPGIPDVAAAMRDGTSTGGSLGLGLPGARRLMDAFALDSRPGRTEVSMARWAGGPPTGELPVTCTIVPGRGGEAMAQPFRNGILLALAAGPRAGDAVRTWRTRPWHAPARLADAGRRLLDPGERLGVAVAGFGALDAQLAWLAAGAVAAALVRDGTVAVRAPAGRALAASGGVPRAELTGVLRDDVLVLAAAPLDDVALAAYAAAAPPPGGPAALVARFARGVLEPRRPGRGAMPHRRQGDLGPRTTLDGP
jgi:serine/threonine-protein kinase RsbT